MIVFHFAFFLNFFSIIAINYYEGMWFFFARSIQWSFLLLVGIGMQLSYQKTIAEGGLKIDFLRKNIRRGAVVFFCGLIITLASFLFFPEAFIRFGILHLIGISIIFLGFLVNYPRRAAFMSACIALASFPISTIIIPESPLVMLGFHVENFYTLDYFPLFPWMGIPALGIWIGHMLLSGYRRHYPAPTCLESSFLALGLAALGQRSLLIYLIHVPIMIGLIFFFQTVL